MAVTMHQLLKTLVDQGGTDLHITTNSPPQIRVHGKMVSLQTPPLTPAETKATIYSVLTDAQRHRFEENLELDLSFGVKGLARFRANVFYQRGAVAGAIRTIPWEIRDFNSLGLPNVVAGLCERPRGLILVTGPTGSGKSTTLAAMVNHLNENEFGHVLTVEDPIEFVHESKKCLVNQREVGPHTLSFANALRSALILSSIAAKVVDLPEPVGPVTRISPRGRSHSEATTVGRPRELKSLISQGMVRMAPATAPRW
jgi:twitching motility protein PilT